MVFTIFDLFFVEEIKPTVSAWFYLFRNSIQYTVKKGYRFSHPQPNVTNQTIPSLIPSRESLISDIPAGDGKTTSLFLQCNPLHEAFYGFQV